MSTPSRASDLGQITDNTKLPLEDLKLVDFGEWEVKTKPQLYNANMRKLDAQLTSQAGPGILYGVQELAWCRCLGDAWPERTSCLQTDQSKADNADLGAEHEIHLSNFPSFNSKLSKKNCPSRISRSR